MTETPKPNPFTDTNPYRADALPDMATRRPGSLTAICVIAVVLGILGLFSGAMKGVNVLFGAEMQQAFGSMGAVTPEQRKVQQELNAAVAEELTRFRLANAILSIAQLALCGTLVYGGLKTLGLKDFGRKVLLTVCMFMLMYEIGQLIVFFFQQLTMGPIMETYMPRLMQTPQGNNAGAEKFATVIARVSIIVGLVFQSVWTLVKFGFFAFAFSHLRKAKIVALFEPNPTSAQTKPEPT